MGRQDDPGIRGRMRDPMTDRGGGSRVATDPSRRGPRRFAPTPVGGAAPTPAPRNPAAPDPSPPIARAPDTRAPDTRTPILHPDYRSTPGYIHGLDGLRALAIVTVFVYHLSDRILPGGFLGVDVFFVVSGFLITTLLLREIAKKGRIGFGGFWLRRARRLLPGLLTVVTVVVSATWITSLFSDAGGDLLVHIGRQVLGSLTFSNNWLEIAAGSSYFANATPLLFVNFWSLAVEEQFYLFWPVLLTGFLAARVLSRHRITAVLLVALASAGAMALLYDPSDPAANPTRVYYGTDTHLFGLMIGVALAFAWAGEGGGFVGTRVWGRVGPTLAGFSLLGILLLMVVLGFENGWTFRGGILLASVLTAIVIAGVIQWPSALQRFMESAPVEWVGIRSYGIYMWHWPVILLVGTWLPGIDGPTPGHAVDVVPGILHAVLAVALTMLLAEASFRWIERPVRTLGFRGFLRGLGGGRVGRAGWVLYPAVATIFVTGALVGVGSAPDASRSEKQILAGEQLADAARERAIEEARRRSEVGEQQPQVVDRDYSVPTGAEIIAIGDSQIAVLGHILHDRLPGVLPDGRSNRQWPDGEAAVDFALQNGIMRRGVILAFGTNGGTNVEVLRRVLDKLGPDRVIVVMNLYNRNVGWIPAANAELEEVVRDRRNVAIGDWYAHAVAHPHHIQPDGFHPNMEGGPVYVDVAMSAFAEIAAR